MNSNKPPSLESLQHQNEFIGRHIGPDTESINHMLHELGLDSLERLVEKTVPAAIALDRPLRLPAAMNEDSALAVLKQLAGKNRNSRSFIGLGYYDTLTPNVILRNVLENPGLNWLSGPPWIEIITGCGPLVFGLYTQAGI